MPILITIVGLGSGDESQLTLGSWNKIQQADQLWLRTEQHPVAAWLQTQGVRYTTFDNVYEQHDAFNDVYEAIVAALLAAASGLADGELVYAVPGHPMVAERTVQLLRERCAEAAIELQILGGESFLEQAFLRFGFDPIEGFQLLDAGDLRRSLLQPRLHTVIAQVYDTFTASDAKLTLMELYPDDYPVTIGHALGVAGQEQIRQVPLYELDHDDGYGNLSLIWIPRTEREDVLARTFDRLHDIVEILRSPEGCPWDREQTHLSIRNNFIEELYEVLEAIDEDDVAGMSEELGDVLLQIMLHAQIEAETGAFSVYDVIHELNEKLVFRHPHVFGAEGAEDAEEALRNWERRKAEEKARKGRPARADSVLAGLPRDLPALPKAWKLQKKAAKAGFDWPDLDGVYAKIDEELAELKQAAAEGSPDAIKSELGDLLFSVINASRFLHVDPEESLALTNRKFIARFSYMEQQLRISGKSFDQTDLLEMEEWWQQAKQQQ